MTREEIEYKWQLLSEMERLYDDYKEADEQERDKLKKKLCERAAKLNELYKGET